MKLKGIKTEGIALDIDETLSLTNRYWVKNMQRLFGNPEGLSANDLVDKYRYTWNIPYWQSENIKKWIMDCIESNELQKELPLIKDSNAYVNKINKIMPVVAYLTLRPESVIKGTQEWLDKHCFPKADIIARPSSVPKENGDEWKAGILEKAYPEIIGLIDDNTSLLRYLNEGYPGIIFFYDNESLPETKIRSVPCKTWKRVYEEVKRYAEEAGFP